MSHKISLELTDNYNSDMENIVSLFVSYWLSSLCQDDYEIIPSNSKITVIFSSKTDAIYIKLSSIPPTLSNIIQFD